MNQKAKEELKQEFVQKLYGEFSTYREHLLCENPTVRQQFESSIMPIDFEAIFGSIKYL